MIGSEDEMQQRRGEAARRVGGEGRRARVPLPSRLGHRRGGGRVGR